MDLPIIPPELGRDPEPVIQPNLGFNDKQENIIIELYSLAWSMKINYPDWCRMYFILKEEEEEIAKCIDAQNLREQEEVNTALKPAPALPRQE